MEKKKWYEPEFRFVSVTDIIVASNGDVDGDIIGWDESDEGFL